MKKSIETDLEPHVLTNENLAPYIQPDSFERRLIDRRQIWAANRFWMEIYNMKTGRYGNKGHHHWRTLFLVMKMFNLFLHCIGLHRQGMRNAENIVLREIPLYFSNLPESFDGFTILHLSDLHLDGIKKLEEKILNIIDGRTFDICVLTGDYRTELHGNNKDIIKGMDHLINNINTRHGFLGVLGNHDDCHMVNPMEKMGIRMLINNACLIHKGDERIQFIGTDDVHYYYTDQALHSLEPAEKEFSIALIHSPEMFDLAALMGVDLYLCGHTHAGQVCLPGGIAILKHLNRGRKYYRGNWRYKNMRGITHAGVGTSGIPIRFNTRGEVLVHTLYKGTGHK